MYLYQSSLQIELFIKIVLFFLIVFFNVDIFVKENVPSLYLQIQNDVL